MRKNLLYDSFTRLTSLRGIRSDLLELSFKDKPELLITNYNPIKIGIESFYENYSILRYPVVNFSNYNNISCIDIQKIMNNDSNLILKFVPDFGIYKDSNYSEVIIDNIESIYNRVTYYFDEIYEAILSKYQIKAKEEKIEFSEKIFDLILFRIDLKRVNTYDEITDEMIVSILVDYFNSNI